MGLILMFELKKEKNDSVKEPLEYY